MYIREIRIDQFGCWQDVLIRSLGSTVSVVHLDDGGHPIDFARFLHGVLHGFDNSNLSLSAGSILLEDGTLLRRQFDSDQREIRHVTRDGKPVRDQSAEINRLRAPMNSLGPLLDPTLDGDRWAWLSENPDILEKLVSRSHQPRPPALESMASISLAPHGKVIEQLGLEREQLLAELASLKADDIAEQKPASTPKVSSEMLVAELTDDLRMLRRQLEPLRAAAEVAERWHEVKKLRHQTGPESDWRELKKLLAQSRSLEEERQDWERKLAAPRRKSRRLKPKRKQLRSPRDQAAERERRELERLLETREWILDYLQNSSLQRDADLFEKSMDHAEGSAELRHAAFLFEEARRDNERMQRRVAEFTRRTAFDWSSLLVDEFASSSQEISSDSEFAEDPPEVQLAELKRRRLWVREEYRWLAEQQRQPSQLMVWIAILFALSIAALFGTLLVVSLPTKWLLTAFGLGGIVSSLSLKLTLDLRKARQLSRSKDRLQQIDNEILLLTERILHQQQDASVMRRRTEEKLHALQLQQDANDASLREDSAEKSFRELLDLHGLPQSYSPREAERALNRKHDSTPMGREESRHPAKLTRWVNRARKFVRRGSQDTVSRDPLELLDQLEDMRLSSNKDHDIIPMYDVEYETYGSDTRDTGRDHSSLASEMEEEERKDARRQLRRIEKRQQTIFQKADVDDVIALEALVEATKQASDQRKRLEAIERELAIVMESRDDGDEIRELLDTCDAEDLRLRLAEKQGIVDETELALQQHMQSKPQTPAPVVDDNAQEVDRVRVRLSIVDTRIRQAMRAAQAGSVMRHVARSLLKQTPVTEETLPLLAELTGGRWTALRNDGGRFYLSHEDQLEQLDPESDDADMAWLALQLRAATLLYEEGDGHPLILLADQLLASRQHSTVFATIRRVAATGIQVLLLAGNRQLVNQIAETGTPVVQVALREEPDIETLPRPTAIAS